MAPSSTSVPGPIAVATQSAGSSLDPIVKFLVRRRILLSAILFVGLVGKDVFYGFKPHDLINIHDPFGVAGGLLVLMGLVLRSWSAGILRKNAKLTTTGPYRLIRNPLYVGSFLMMGGFCALLNNPLDLWFILGPIAILYVVKVRQEERLLAELFPDEWPDYARTTPRLLPRPVPTDLRSDWRFSQWMRSREYQALGATILALVALKIWQTYG
jgi:protein-S-isoprenylcysteine O-methyltransferase Ste14